MARTSADNVTYSGEHSACGYVIGTGAAIRIIMGWCPRKVELYNTEGNCFGVWVKNMDAGSIFKTVDSGSGTTDISLVTSGGITIIGADEYSSTDKVSGDGMGFIIGTDSDINVSGEDIYFFASK